MEANADDIASRLACVIEVGRQRFELRRHASATASAARRNAVQ